MRSRGLNPSMISALSAFSILFFVLLTGCSDDKSRADAAQKESSSVAAAGEIEIVKNENAGEIKVKEKETDQAQSKSYYYDYNIKSEYDENAVPENDDASVRAKPRTAIDANMNVRSPYEEVQVSLLVRKLSKNFIVKCSACHNDYANGIIGPSLLGRDSDFIFNSIMKFKRGEKVNVLMTDLVKMMDENEIRGLADEIYQFNEEIKKMGK
jgi:cytochrome c553